MVWKKGNSQNKTEQAAYAWIKKNYPKEEVSFSARQSPDFIAASGKSWEAKRLYPPKSVIFGPSQIPLFEKLNPTILVFRDGELEPCFKFLYSERKKTGLLFVMSPKYATTLIRVSNASHSRLLNVMRGQESFDDVLSRLLDGVEKKGGKAHG